MGTFQSSQPDRRVDQKLSVAGYNIGFSRNFGLNSEIFRIRRLFGLFASFRFRWNWKSSAFGRNIRPAPPFYQHLSFTSRDFSHKFGPAKRMRRFRNRVTYKDPLTWSDVHIGATKRRNVIYRRSFGFLSNSTEGCELGWKSLHFTQP